MRTVSAAKMLVSQPDAACILVVEDEFLIRFMISEIIRDAGYTVIEAANADEAMDVIQSEVQVDLVFSDVAMPGSIDGLGLLKAAKTLRPSLPVLVTSGHCDPALALSGGATRFVPKPYDMAAVVELVAHALGSSE